jgi:hypothetical protein
MGRLIALLKEAFEHYDNHPEDLWVIMNLYRG